MADKKTPMGLICNSDLFEHIDVGKTFKLRIAYVIPKDA